MAIDPFDNISIPKYDNQLEVGQPTFVEIISAKLVETKPAIGKATPDVKTSLNRLAFGKEKYPTQRLPLPATLSIPTTPGQRYIITGPQQSSAQSLKSAKVHSEFRVLTTNAFSVDDSCPDFLRGNPIGTNLFTCDGSDDCAVDLAIILDVTGSMSLAIQAVKNGIQQIIQLLADTIGNNYRLSLVTFNDLVVTNVGGLPIVPFEQCGQDSLNYFNIIIDSVVASGGGDAPESNAAAALFSTYGNGGCWRDDAVKAMVIITDAPNQEGIQTHGWPPISGSGIVTVNMAATAAAARNIRIAHVGLPLLDNHPAVVANNTKMRAEGELYAEITNGISISANRDGSDLVPLLSSFIFSLCAERTFQPECNSSNIYLNDNFDTVQDLNSWEILGTATWASANEFESPINSDIVLNSVKLMRGNAIRKTITGLTPGHIATLNYNWCIEYIGSDVTSDSQYNILGEIRSSTGDGIGIPGEPFSADHQSLSTLPGSGPVIITGLIDHSPNTIVCSQNRASRAPVRVRIPEDGVIIIHIQHLTHSSNIDHVLYVDNVLVCVTADESCGPGRINLVRNSDFELGVEEWTDSSDNPLPPTDPSVWDSISRAIVVDITRTDEVRQTITDLVPNQNYTMSFEISSNEPSNVPEIELVYGILNAADDMILEQDVVSNTIIQPTPRRLSINFTTPNQAVKIFFKTGFIGGITKIRDILICSQASCSDGFESLSFSSFSTGRDGGWSGGTYDAAAGGLFTSTPISQTFTGLEPGTFANFAISSSLFPNLTPSQFASLVTSVFGSSGTGDIILLTATITSDGRSQQLITPDINGNHSIGIQVGASGTVTANISRFRLTSSIEVVIESISLCASEIVPACGSINNVQVMLEWDGIPRQPVNIFDIAIAYTVRNPADPLDITTIAYIPESVGRLSIATCDFWKSQTLPNTTVFNNPRILSGIETLLNDIDDGAETTAPLNIYAIRNSIQYIPKTNWLWSIPQSGGIAADNLIINFPNPGPGSLIENVRILLFANKIILSPDTVPTLAPPLGCGDDPANRLNIILRYTNSSFENREFSTTLSLDDILNQNVDSGINLWDTNVSSGNGILGTSADWNYFDFRLDSVDGRGIDQCTDPITSDSSGDGDLLFGDFILNGRGLFIDTCLSEIIISNILDGSSINEIQSIILPNTTGGIWNISWVYDGITDSVDILWDVTATQLQDALESFDNIGAGNIAVSGSGTTANPFLAEFKGGLGATSLPLLVTNGTALSGISGSSVITSQRGTTNERRTITNTTGTTEDVVLRFPFGGGTGDPDGDFGRLVTIPYGSSLNTVQSLIESVWSVGVGNVLVTGNTTNRDAPNSGPYIVDYINDRANMPIGGQNGGFFVEDGLTSGYTMTRNWAGGSASGTNTTQIISINALSGTFELKVYKTVGFVDYLESEFVQTDPIPFNANSDVLRDAIVLASTCPVDPCLSTIVSDDIEVRSITADVTTGDYAWEIEYKGQYSGLDVPGVQFAESDLSGAPIDITVTESQSGVGVNDLQRITIINANGGSFKLTVRVDDVDYQTNPIPWNTTAEGLQAQLTSLSPFISGDISVMRESPTAGNQNLRAIVTFRRKFNDIPLMVPEFQETLLCDPVYVNPVDPGPYPYERPKPVENPRLIIEPCCDAITITDSANISIDIKLERDVVSSSPIRTIKDLAAMKGLKISDHVPYIRNQITGKLSEIAYDTVVGSKTSIVLIANELNTDRWRGLLETRLRGAAEILPSRFNWPICDRSDPNSSC